MQGVVHRRWGEFLQNFLVDLVGSLRSPNRASSLPSFIVAPIAQIGLVKGGGIAVLRVLDAKEMPLIANLTHRFNSDIFWTGGTDFWLHIALYLLQDLAVHNELFRAGDQPAFQPPSRMVDHMGPRLHCRPKRVRCLPHGLAIWYIGRANTRRAHRQTVVTRHLPCHLRRPHILRRAKSRGARFHIHI